MRQDWPADQIGAVVVVEQLTAFGQPPTPNTFVLDTEGRCILRPTSQMWTDGEVGRLVGSIGRTPERIKEPIAAGALRKRYPRAVPWWEAHIFASALIAAGAFILVLFVYYMM